MRGVRVVDLTTVVMGPLSTRALGDLGADVIRVEAPGGDFMRDFEPKRNPKMSAFSMNVNRNKRSVVLDLKDPVGRQAMLDLVASADVFVSNVRPKALAGLKLSDSDLRAVQPELIYCSATGFGSDGPYADKAAYDDVIQAASGMASMFAWHGQEPSYMPAIIADKVAALHITYAVLAALYRKATTGKGDFIEVPMAESLASFNLVEHLNGHTFEPKQEPFSYPRLRTQHRKPRKTADGWACILPYSDQNWIDFFRLAGLENEADDPRFATVNARVANVDALYSLLDDAVRSKTTAEWMSICDDYSIPAAPVVDLENLADDPHFKAVGLVHEAQHPTEGPYRVVRDPLRFKSGLPGVHQPAAGLGQHTASIFSDLGYSSDDIDLLEAMNMGVVPQAAATNRMPDILGAHAPGVPD